MPESEATGGEGEFGLLLTLRTSPGNRRELLVALYEFRQRELAEPGCTACQVLEDTSDANSLVWTEWWLDKSRADLAIGRPRFRALLGAIKLLGGVERAEWLARRSGPALWPPV